MSSPAPDTPTLRASSPTTEPQSPVDLPGPEDEHDNIEDVDAPLAKKKRATPAAQKKPSAEVLQRRKEGRIKAAATIAHNLKKTGIGRFEAQNGFGLTSMNAVPLINQKNYFTDYLRRDEQILFVRNWRSEKIAHQKLKLGDNAPSLPSLAQPTSGTATPNAAKNFDDFDLNDIQSEMARKKKAAEKIEAAAAAAAAAQDEEEDEDDEDDESEEVRAEKARIGHDTIIIHPGSAYTRIGRATDAVPVTIPTVIAVRAEDGHTSEHVPYPLPKRSTDENGALFFGNHFEECKSLVTKDFKTRMRYYKRRILPNSRESAANYNRKQEPEQIPDHNDPYKKEWVDPNDKVLKEKSFFVGEDALKLPLDSQKFAGWKLRYPIVNGTFNVSLPDYASPQEILGDMANIIGESLKLMEVDTDLLQLKVLLIITDLYDKTQVETFMDMLFKYVGFGRVGIMQESVAATFGAGATSACVVDVGAQTTSISCVDEGMVISDSRIRLNYGGDHVTEALLKLLLENCFPFGDIDLSRRNDDWELAQNLKHNFVTCQDADIAVQLYTFYKRRPFEPTLKYEFKCFDEVMLAPLGLFYPEIFHDPSERPLIPSLAFSKEEKVPLFGTSTDQYSLKVNNPISKAQENLANGIPYADMGEGALIDRLCDSRNSKIVSATPAGNITTATDVPAEKMNSLFKTPLEKAIIESITSAGLATDLAKISKLYDNLLIVGGGFAKVPGFDLVLTDRINIWRPKVLSTNAIDAVVTYACKSTKQMETAREEAILAYRENKASSASKSVDEVVLLPEEVEEATAHIESEFDLAEVDAMCDSASTMPVNVLPPPREFDPEMLTWKGGCVYGRLKVINEMWISRHEWDVLQTRCIYYKSLFHY